MLGFYYLKKNPVKYRFDAGIIDQVNRNGLYSGKGNNRKVKSTA